jgi:hypothetical protein
MTTSIKGKSLSDMEFKKPTSPNRKRKLSEVALPLEAINAAAAPERLTWHGHPPTSRVRCEWPPTFAVAVSRGIHFDRATYAVRLDVHHYRPKERPGR